MYVYVVYVHMYKRMLNVCSYTYIFVLNAHTWISYYRGPRWAFNAVFSRIVFNAF